MNKLKRLSVPIAISTFFALIVIGFCAIAVRTSPALPNYLKDYYSLPQKAGQEERGEAAEASKPARPTTVEAEGTQENVSINVTGPVKGFELGFVLPPMRSPFPSNLTIETERGDRFVQHLARDQELELHGVPLAGTLIGEKKLETGYGGLIFEITKGKVPTKKEVSLKGDFVWGKGPLLFTEEEKRSIWKHVGPLLR